VATIFGTNGADALIGTATADAIYGFQGDDSISGGAGRDSIYGGQGNDTLDGGAGPDFLEGGSGFDLALYSRNTTPVWADLRTGIVRFPGQSWPNETLVGIEAIAGGSGRDTFIGDGGANLFMGEAASDTLIGNMGADTLIGGVGADSLEGGSGGDDLAGGSGNDTLLGGAGDDLFLVRAGEDRDLIHGGSGSDTLYAAIRNYDPELPGEDSSNFTNARINLALGTLRLGDGPRSSLASIEFVETGGGNDSVNGSRGDDFISVGDGANVVYAGSGDDTIIGGRYLDYDGYGSIIPGKPGETLNGGTGDDLIVGHGAVSLRWDDVDTDYSYEIAPESLAGGAGNDTIEAGAGPYQQVSGGSGADTFVISDDAFFYGFGSLRDDGDDEPGLARITITDFDPDQDVIRVRFDHSPRQEITWLDEWPQWPDEILLQYQGVYGVGSDGAVLSIALTEQETQYGTFATINLPGYTGPLSGIDFEVL
jgi:Ca2+-binding RTX toxin-like protein